MHPLLRDRDDVGRHVPHTDTATPIIGSTGNNPISQHYILVPNEPSKINIVPPLGSDLALVARILAAAGPHSAEVGQFWPSLGRRGPNLGPMLTDAWPMLVDSGPLFAIPGNY